LRITVFGAGAIGGLVGARLALAGHEVTLIARGAHLAALRDRGLTLEDEHGRRTLRLAATTDPAAPGPQDAVILGVKATAVAAALPALGPLLGPATPVVPILNGIPWWYAHGLPGAQRPLESIDPGGAAWHALDRGRILGCVTYAAAEVTEPGTIRHATGRRFVLGEPDGSRTARVLALSETFAAAGFEAPVSSEIRTEIWLKAWGNAAFNPLSVLTGATTLQMMEDAPVAAVLKGVMAEVAAVAEASGVRLPMGIDERFEAARMLGHFRTSMLQDFEAGRPLELDAILGVVVELGAGAGVPTPLCAAILALVRQRAALRPAAGPQAKPANQRIA